MLKKVVKYTDYNDDPAVETLYFNLNRNEVLELDHLAPRLEAWHKKTSGESRDLTMEEIREILDVVKILVEKSYGVRSDDGKRFIKNQGLFDEFTQTAVYDEFLFSMFENPTEAVNFISGILPKQIVETLEKNGDMVELPQPSLTKSSTPDENDDRPQWLRENREPTRGEMERMDKEEMALAFRMKSNGEI